MNDVFTQMINIAYVYEELFPNYDVCPGCSKGQISRFASYTRVKASQIRIFHVNVQR